MNFTNLLLLVFLMSAFAIGVSIQPEDNQILQQGLDNMSIVMQNITLEPVDNEYANGLHLILEKFVGFMGVTFVEITRMGISFGMDNPDYFEPSFIFSIVKLIVVLVIVSLLIKPISYLVVLIVLLSMWVIEKINKRKKKDE